MPTHFSLFVAGLVAALPIAARAEERALPADAVPVAAFYDGTKIHLLDLSVRGAFPSAFSIAALPAPMGLAASKTGAWRGIIAAAARDHPREVSVPQRTPKVACTAGVTTNVLINQPENGPYLVRPLAPDAQCTYELSITLESDSYYEKRICGPSFSGFLSTCPRVEQHGNAALLQDPFAALLGRAGTLTLLHLQAPQPAGSRWSTGVAGGRDLPEGTYVLERAPLTADDVAANERCRVWLAGEAVAVYNAAHGTDFDLGTDTHYITDAMFDEIVANLRQLEQTRTCMKMPERLVTAYETRAVSVQPQRVLPVVF